MAALMITRVAKCDSFEGERERKEKSQGEKEKRERKGRRGE